MLIAIDIDDVLAEFIPALATYYNERFGVSLRKEDFHTHKFNEVWGGSLERTIGIVGEFVESPYFLNMSTVEGAVDGVRKLGSNLENSLISVTARPARLRDLTLDFIRRHFPDIKEVYFAQDAFNTSKNGIKKVDYCRALRVDALVEDYLEYARECGEAGIDVVLFDQPWNREETPERVTRVSSWNEIIEYFK